MFTVCLCPFQLTALHFCLLREQSMPLCAPVDQVGSAFLAPFVLAAFVHLGTQTASVGVLQAVGVVCTEALSLSHSLCLLPGHPHTYKKTLTTHCKIQVLEQTRVSQNHFMNSKMIVWGFFFGCWSELPEWKISHIYNLLTCCFAFGKYRRTGLTDWALEEPFSPAAVFAFWLLHYKTFCLNFCLFLTHFLLLSRRKFWIISPHWQKNKKDRSLRTLIRQNSPVRWMFCFF